MRRLHGRDVQHDAGVQPHARAVRPHHRIESGSPAPPRGYADVPGTRTLDGDAGSDDGGRAGRCRESAQHRDGEGRCRPSRSLRVAERRATAWRHRHDGGIGGRSLFPPRHGDRTPVRRHRTLSRETGRSSGIVADGSGYAARACLSRNSPSRTLNTMARSINIAGVSLELEERGSGRPLLFLHPGEGLQPQLEWLDLLARHFRVIAPHHPGWGNSALPDWLMTVDDLAYLYLDVAALLKLEQAV